MTSLQLSTSLEYVKGVGTKTAEQLARAGLVTVHDLIYFLPRAYEDLSLVQPIAGVKPGKVSLRGHFSNIRSKQVRRGMSITEATLTDASGKLPVVWFNQSYRKAQISKDAEFLVTGEFGLQRNQYQLVNPSVEQTEGAGISGGRIVPMYRQTGGLKAQLVRKLLSEIEPFILAIPETLPPELVKKEKLLSHAAAVHAMHFPRSMEDVEAAKQRLGFEELLALLMAALKNRQENESLASYQIAFDERHAKDFVTALPFELTNAQRIAAWESIKNLKDGRPMNRLLQGDVGAGKTVVAALVAYIAAQEGYQTAFMAPTELLARQHGETLRSVLEPLGVSVGLLTGSVKGKGRQQLYDAIASGQAQLVVGTHALIQDKVKFHRLGFVVIDEQHRFGVEQRQKLLTKSERMPHLLAMTATPIPRSLQLTVYGELDISILNEKPKNRLPIETKIISPNSRAQMYKEIAAELEKGHQMYVICPRISDAEDTRSVETEVNRLKPYFRKWKIGKLHGQLPAEEKNAVMQAFASGELDILVSTTVVEVGVDVPNATVMIIENADKFGLAQLHQLRGRVGRSHVQSYCYLVPSTSVAPSARLRELEKSNDGFYLAERDLELRGPGEIYGRAQHGALNLSVASLGDTKLLKQVRASALWLLARDLDLLQYKRLQAEVERYRRLTTLN